MRVLPPGSISERQNPLKLEKVAFSHFFDILRQAVFRPPFYISSISSILACKLPYIVKRCPKLGVLLLVELIYGS